jgi:cytochrome P450
MKDLSLPEAIAGSPLPKRPPGPPGLPLLGNMRPLLRDNLKFVMDMARQYGDVVLYHLGAMSIYQVNHPDGVQHILQENNRNYSKDTLNFGTVKMLLGNSLLSSDGDFWRRQRRLMQPVFHRRHVAALGELMTQKTVVTLTQWQRLAGNGRPLDIQAEMMALTLEKELTWADVHYN